MRDRLIELIKDIAPDLVAKCGDECDKCTHGDCVGKLADHLLANGVIVLPCTIGQTIYALWNCGKHGKSVAEFEVKHIDIDYLPNIEFAYISKTSNSGTYHFAKLSDFGKTVFFTREEAEKALERSEKCSSN